MLSIDSLCQTWFVELVKLPLRSRGGMPDLDLWTVFFLSSAWPCRSAQRHDWKQPPQCCTLKGFAFLLPMSKTTRFEFIRVLILSVSAHEQRTPGQDGPVRLHRPSAPCGAAAKDHVGNAFSRNSCLPTEHQVPKPGPALRVCTVFGLRDFSAFEVQLLVLRGL